MGEGRVRASAAVLNKEKVNPRREGDRFKVVGRVTNAAARRVSIGAGNCGMLPHIQTLDRLPKREPRIEIRVVRADAVSRPKTSVHRKLCKIGQPRLS